MTTRLLAFAALLSAASFHLAIAQEQTADGQCNCPKCQAARQAAAADAETLAAQPAGMFSSEGTGIFAPDAPSLFEMPDTSNWFKGKSHQPVQQAGFHHHHGYCPPSGPYVRQAYPGHGSHGYPPAAGTGLGTFPYGSHYDHGHPGRPFDGGRYGYFGGAHRTPGYPHHHFHREYVGPQGPPTAHVAYPYYTIRGPRDFLLDNPPSIGR
jgi:hypothetical protein